MSQRKSSARENAYCALFAVLISVCAWITVPLVVPVTMQTFAIFLAIDLLGARRAVRAMLVYILLGAIGVPVFSGFGGGIGVLLGPTGGYLLGFLLAAPTSYLVARVAKGTWGRALGMLAGLLVCYAFGTAWFMLVYTRAQGTISLAAALSTCVLPFVLPDLAKLALAFLLARRLRPRIKW